MAMTDFKCEFKDCGKEAVGWGLMEKKGGDDEHSSIDPGMPTLTMCPLCAEHFKGK